MSATPEVIPGCPGDGRKARHPTEDGSRVQVSTTHNQDDHSVYARYDGAGVPPPLGMEPRSGGLGIGRFFRPDELEAGPPPWCPKSLRPGSDEVCWRGYADRSSREGVA